MRGSDTCELVFDNCLVPAGRSSAIHILPKQRTHRFRPRECAGSSRQWSRCSHVWFGLGTLGALRWASRVGFFLIPGVHHILPVPEHDTSRLMQAAFDFAVTYVHERQQFGQPVGTFQLMQGARASWSP